MKDFFSKRHGFSKAQEVDITIREDAPDELRGYLIQLCYECGFKPSDLRSILCQSLKKQPDKNNWSEFPNVDWEVNDLMQGCKWYKVYDVIERIQDHLGLRSYTPDVYEHFHNELNEYFVENGIGWKLANGLVEIRGPETFEVIVKKARETEYNSGHVTASKELHEAIADLSRRPNPDPTGAIQHAMASLECVARQITGDVKANLGDIMKRHSSIIPAPLDQAVVKAWGYASENGRHIREGREPSFNEAELIVGLCASLGNYLIKNAWLSTPE
ncbi:AbiJ-NTD4 domain-containing protein [Pseudomonas sp. KHB2.9]